MEFSLEILGLFFLIALAAGTIDGIAGGGGLITMPALLALGLPPTAAVATNKLGATGGSFAAALHFVRARHVNLREFWPWMLASFVGSIFGSFLLTQLDNRFLEKAIPILLIGFALYFLFSPRVGAEDRKKRLSLPLFGLTLVPLIGFYDGFFGPGTGSFFTLAAVTLLGFNLLKATAHAKQLNFASNAASLLFFIYYGEIYWVLGGVMLIGQLCGGMLGARMAVRNGQQLIRWVMVIVSVLMSAKLIIYPAG